MAKLQLEQWQPETEFSALVSNIPQDHLASHEHFSRSHKEKP
jgi:hypothetical protein